MKKYMVIGHGDGEQWARFFDDYIAADNYRMDGAVSLGYVMQVYELQEMVENIGGKKVVIGFEYKFLYE